MKVTVHIYGHQGEGKSTLAATLTEFLKRRGVDFSIRETQTRREPCKS